jgi:hypothetical protein
MFLDKSFAMSQNDIAKITDPTTELNVKNTV